jgi:hypothetical protein
MTKEFGGEGFSERRRSLEEAFFKERDRQLLEKLRGELNSFEESKKLAHVSGIVAERVLQHLVAAGVKAETLAAVSLIPMVEVAWSDGNVSGEERDAVLNAAAKQGIPAGSAAHDLLREWLTHRPDSHVITAWKEYVQEVSRMMPPESLAEMRKQMLDRCRKVAAAAGGFLGLNTISKVEQSTIESFEQAWHG